MVRWQQQNHDDPAMPIDNVPDHVSTSSEQTTDSQPNVTSTSTIQPDPAVATIISPP